MIAVIQRVSHASVTIDGSLFSEIGKGLLILVGVRKGDTEAEAVYLASKCTGLRIFEDEAGKMNCAAAVPMANVRHLTKQSGRNLQNR